MSRKSERDAERAAWLKQAGDLVPDRFRGPDEWRVLTWLRDLEAEVTRLKKQLEYGDVTPASAVAAEVALLRENNEALGLKVNELEAEAAAMREALENTRDESGECPTCTWNPGHDLDCAIGNALASDAGKAVLERLANAEVNAGLRECAADAATLRAEQARAQAFEQAAQVADKEARRLNRLEHLPGNPVVVGSIAVALEKLAAAIRAKAKEGT